MVTILPFVQQMKATFMPLGRTTTAAWDATIKKGTR